jgi:hypothetical protein
MGLLQRDGHVKSLWPQIGRDDSLSVTWRDDGRNFATTFEGFCSAHDTSLFLPIDTRPLNPSDQEQLFLYAYRAVARELHESMEAALKVQSLYQQRIEAGIDKGDEPEIAGMLAVEKIHIAHSVFVYKCDLDLALGNSQFDILLHEVMTLADQSPAIAVSAFFDLDTSQNGQRPPFVSLNIVPISTTETIAIFSYVEKDAAAVRDYIREVVEADREYQKYLLSRMVLTHAENFVVSPLLWDTWSLEKRETIREFFLATLRLSSPDSSKHLYLF